MTNILDIINQEKPLMSTKKSPKAALAPVEEKAQIVVMLDDQPNALVVRYDSVKAATREFDAAHRAWKQLDEDLFTFDGSAFMSVVDLNKVASISLVDHAIRDNFTAR